MRRVIKFLIIAMLFAGIFPSLAFAYSVNEIAGWSVTYSEETSMLDRNTHYARLDNTVTYSGNTSLFISYPSDQIQGNFISIYQPVNSIVNDNYTITFYAKGTYDSSKLSVGVSDESATLIRAVKTPIIVALTDMGDGWTKYVIRIAYSGQPKFFQIKVDGPCPELWIDDITIAPSAGGTNLLRNPSFNLWFFKETSGTILPEKVLVTEGGGFLALSWRNPVKAGLAEIKVVDTETNEPLIYENYSMTSGAINELKIANLSNNKTYVYNLVFRYSDGTVIQKEAGGVPGSRYVHNISGWGQRFTVPSKGYVPAEVSVDRNVKRSGMASAHIVSNINGWQDNTYFYLNKSVALDSSKTYKMSFYLKGNSMANFVLKDLSAWSNTFSFNDTIADWRLYELNITGKASINFAFFCEGNTKDAWIDDFSIFEIDNGVQTGENLALNGGFEEGLDEIPPENITVSNTVLSDSTAEITWINPEDSDFVKTNVYVDVGEGYELSKTVYAPSSSVILKGLANGKNSSVLFLAADKAGNLSSGTEIKVNPTADPLKISDYKYYVGNTAIQTIRSGQITTKIGVKNSFAGNDFTAELIVALYQGDKMVDVVTEFANMPETEQWEDYEYLEATIYVPSAQGYHLEVMLWDSINGMNILRENNILN